MNSLFFFGPCQSTSPMVLRHPGHTRPAVLGSPTSSRLPHLLLSSFFGWNDHFIASRFSLEKTCLEACYDPFPLSKSYPRGYMWLYVPVASVAGAGVPPMVWVSPWKAEATLCVMLATPSSAYITKHTSWQERRPCKRHHTTHTMHLTSHITDNSAYTRPHASKCYTPP